MLSPPLLLSHHMCLPGAYFPFMVLGGAISFTPFSMCWSVMVHISSNDESIDNESSSLFRALRKSCLARPPFISARCATVVCSETSLHSCSSVT